MKEITVIITPEGRVRFIYDDALAPLIAQGTPHTRRASHVEPTADGRWTADMAPVGGPVLGPFPLHADAIEAERAWLNQPERLAAL